MGSADPEQQARGANIARKKSVLGRGLHALMSPSAVPVDFVPGGNLPGTGAPAAPRASHTPQQGQPGRAVTPEAASSSQATAAGTAAAGTAAGGTVAGGSVAVESVAVDSAEERETPYTDLPAAIRESAQRVAEPPSGDPQILSHDGAQEGLLYVPIDRVFPNKAQPRQHFPQEEIDRLADSLRKTGLLQPILVRRRAAEQGPLPTYEIIAGERRWRAARQAGLAKIPAIQRQLSDREALELGIVENVQRSDLNPIEEALAYYRLAEEFGANQSEIAEKVGKDRTSIANSLRLLKLSEEVQRMLVDGMLSAGHGRAILAAASPAEQRVLADRIVTEGLSVREVEQIVSVDRGRHRQSRSRSDEKGGHSDPQTTALEDRLRRGLGTKVKLRLSTDGQGELKISFFSQGELESLLDRLQV